MLKGKRIIVTGGASGMGMTMVGGYAERGAQVVSLDIDPAGAKIAKAAGGGFIVCDVADQGAVDGAVSKAAEMMGGIDVLVHAAGTCPPVAAEAITLEQWSSVMAINATSTFLLNQAVFPFLKTGGGKIINFASGQGVLGAPGQAHYAASKGAVLAWSRSLAAAWGRYGITVNTIAPAIWTPMYDKTRASMTPTQLEKHDEDQARKRLIGGRLGDAERDFMPMMAFLASDGANFLTGQLYKIDGGGLMLS